MGSEASSVASVVTEPQKRRGRGRSRRNEGEYVVPRTGPRPVRAAVRVMEQIGMIALALIALAPFYAMVVTSLKSTREFSEHYGSIAPPTDPTFEKYTQAWTDLGFAKLITNSLILSVSCAIATTLIAILAGFALSRLEFAARRPLLIAVIALMSVPAMVIIIPLFLLMADMRMVNTYPAAIIAEIGLNVPFGTYLIYTFMREIPKELFQAAKIEGASAFKQLIWIAVPLSRAVIMTVVLISALFAWNDLLVPLVLWQSEDLRVLMVGLANLAPGRQGGVDVPLVMAGVSISVVPVVVLFLFTRRFFVKGLLEGSLK
jgi:raffinose/stachyose/melibiose transport system permease protein